jgi:peptidoglycan hydrolase-like protein with peptidoglycan-binding domain
MTEPLTAVGSRSGSETARAQWRLLELGFWVQNADGEYGLTTKQAVMAFQKYYGLEADGVLGDATAAAMSSVTEKPRGRADAGTLVEVDKSKQLIFFVVDGVTQWIVNTSTGTEIPYEEPNKNDPTKIEKGDSVTPVGLFDVYRERDLPPEVLPRRRGRARLQQHPELPRLARLRPGERARDGLDLGHEHDADEHPGVGARSDPDGLTGSSRAARRR